MAKYIKHNSNYIRTDIHQFLKGGSTIFERDWVTVGSQLNFGPGKIPYYRDGNFIFTTSMIPRYQKKHKNGVTVATWTYEDVKDASPIVNQIQLDEHTEDIRSYAYYGSCVELLRASIENIINTFPGNITVANEELGVYKTVEEFVCGGEDVEEMYVPLTGYWPLSNPFDINVYLKNVHLTQYDNPLRYLTHSFDKYQVSIDNGGSFSDITSYEVVMRKMYEKVAPPCIETIKKSSGSATLAKNESKTISLSSGKYFIEINNVKKNNWQTLCYDDGESPFFTLTRKAKSVAYVVEEGAESGNIVLTLSNDETQTIDTSSEETVKIYFYKEQKIQRTYKYYQMFDDEQYQETYKAQGWVESTCIMDFWLPDSVFLNRCDEYQRNVLYSELSGIGKNLPVYTVTINDSILIEGYIYNRQVVPLVTNLNLIIQPKKEVIEEYFDTLEGFEKQLLTRKTKPLYTNRFVTPIEYNLGYLYYKRTYTWPSNGYCIDIVSPRYLDFVNKLGKTAELLDELWTDNLWRRMTHEAIKNYDWTYTREFEEGEEQDNVDGGERMHKVINVIGRVFDDVKRTIDTIKRNNKVSYDEDRNMPNALISDKLEIQGWDIYSTIPSYTDEDTGEIVSANEQTVETEFLENKGLEWYPALDSSKMTFADVDIKFMRRLLLSTKRIFQTKGTRHGIDMIMGMFGYGNMDETQPNYTITEEYYHVVPRKYDEPFDENYTFGDKIVYLNEKKDIDRIYYEDASGIPVGSFIGEYDKEGKPITYLIPFYNQNKIYDGYKLYFQTKGGWLYNKVDENEEEPNPYNWTETLSYLHVVPQVKDLFDINPYDIREGDIYYVVNINDYINYTEVELYSNFFVVKNQFMPELLNSWVNLNLNEGFYEDEEDAEKYDEYVKKAIYLDSIIPYTIGNNPHVGYGNYDQGKEYLDYMKKPFKFSIDEKHLIYEDEVDADKINFDKNVSGSTTNENGKPYWVHYPDAVNNEDKIQIFVKGEDEDGVIKEKYDIVNDILNPSETHWGVLDYNTYDMEKAKELIKEKYFLNSKVIHFKNLIQGNNYKLYFREVILKYLMQLIPSTTIFIMEGFELTDDGSGNKPQYRWITASGEYICDGTDKYAKQKRQMSTDGGTTWTDTGQTKKGDLIERNSRDCGYFEPQYRWVDISGDYECVGTDKYAKQKKQVSNDGGRTWRDTGETQRGNLIERNSTDCGYIAPQYRWVNVDNEYVCVGTTKYNKEKKQVSNDGGRTWSDTNETRTGTTVLEQYSTDCGYEALTRWVTIQGEYACVGTDKYNKEKKQISNDNGTTWVDTGDTRTGTTLIERNSADCGYNPEHTVRWVDNHEVNVPIDETLIEGIDDFD